MEEAGWRGLNADDESTKLQVARARIDKLDETIAGLLKERLDLAKAIGTLKAETNMPVKDGAREQIVLDHVRDVVGEPELAEAVARVYSQLLQESRMLQGEGAAKRSTAASPTSFPRVLIIGCGLIGGAMARRIKSVHPATVIVGCDRAEVMADALASAIVDEAVADPVDAAAKASLIILAASPKQNIELLKKLAPVSTKRQVIMDVTSAKGPICNVAAELKMKADFVGGHPFFGSQKSGWNASAELSITGKRFVLTPNKQSSELSLRRLTKWLEQLGMIVEVRSSEEHDATVAGTSHLVQLLSVALGSLLANGVTPEQLRDRLRLSGPGLQTISRLMESPYSMWAEILEQNSSAVCSALSLMESRLHLMRTAISTGQFDVIEAQFNTARKVANNLQR